MLKAKKSDNRIVNIISQPNSSSLEHIIITVMP